MADWVQLAEKNEFILGPQGEEQRRAATWVFLREADKSISRLDVSTTWVSLRESSNTVSLKTPLNWTMIGLGILGAGIAVALVVK